MKKKLLFDTADCKQPARIAVMQDNTIEDKCKEFIEGIYQRMKPPNYHGVIVEKERRN